MFFECLRPIDEPVDVIDKEDDGRNQCCDIIEIILHGQCPQGDENDIIQCIAEGIEAASSGREIGGKETREDGDGGDDEIVCIQCLEDEIESTHHGQPKKETEYVFFRLEFIDFDFIGVSFARMAEPGNECHDGNRSRHSQIGDHLSIIPGRIGDDAIEDREKNRSDLSDGGSFGHEHQGSHADERCCQLDIVRVSKKEETEKNNRQGNQVETPFKDRKIADEFFHFRYLSQSPLC